MDESAVDAPPERAPSELTVFAIDGVEVAAFAAVVSRLSEAYPAVAPARIETILLREWEAFAAGRPLVVPIAVEAGVREILDGR